MNIVTVRPEDPLREAARKMREHHVGDVVVVGESPSGEGTPLGILTDRDIVLSTVALGIDPALVNVEDVMTPTPITARSTDSFSRVLQLMKDSGVKRIPLINDRGTLEGILSTQDVLEKLVDELRGLVSIQGRQHDLEVRRRRKVS